MGVLLRNTPYTVKNCTPKKAGYEAFAIGICFLTALLLHYFDVDVSGGVLPDFVTRTGLFGHKGFICPLCGGTRAFIMVSTMEFTEALHFSLLGTYIAFWVLLTFPVRLFYRLIPASRKCKRAYLFVRRMENPDFLIIGMAVFLLVQLGLHYIMDFRWIPLSQLD